MARKTAANTRKPAAKAGRKTAAGTRLRALVRWFNPEKGFGYVAPEDGSPQAFLKLSVVNRGGFVNAPDGAILECRIGEGQNGPIVTKVDSVAPTRPVPASAAPADLPLIPGVVKSFSAVRGSGTVTPDDGGAPVKLDTAAVRRSGLLALKAGTRVRVAAKPEERGARVGVWLEHLPFE